MRPTSPVLRHGLSLMELLLVLALMVVLAAVVLPNIGSSFQTQRLRSAADLVRSEWSRARVKAMRSGVIYAFVFQPGEGLYRVEPWLDVGDEDLAIDPVTGEVAGGLQVTEGELPEGVTFVLGDIVMDARYAQAYESSTAIASRGLIDSSQTILFYPDGATSTARVLLKTERDLPLGLELRGLTGVSRVFDVSDEGASMP